MITLNQLPSKCKILNNKVESLLILVTFSWQYQTAPHDYLRKNVARFSNRINLSDISEILGIRSLSRL